MPSDLHGSTPPKMGEPPALPYASAVGEASPAEGSYDVYGVGNALVDVEHSVDDTFLSDHGIAKGHMTLVDNERMETLVASLDGREATRMCGGSAANTAYAVCGFGGRSFYSCRVAGDETGAYFLEEIRAAGVDTNPHDPRARGNTGRCLVLVTADAERSMNTCLGISETLAESDINVEALARTSYLYIEGYLSSSTTGRAAAVHAREVAESEGVRTSMTLSDPAMVEFFRDGLTAMLGNGVHQLFCNEEEALAWTRSDRVDIAANELRDIAPCVNITLGSAGCLVVTGTNRRQVPGYQVTANDTTGAGDIYAGACLYGLTHGGSSDAAARFANFAAAQLVTRYGARLANADAYVALRNNFPG